MAFCSNCGAEVAQGAATCSKCGKPATVSTGGGAAAAPAPAAAPAAGLADNIAGLLCYSPVGIIADIIFLVTDPYKTNKFLRFHSFQSLFFAGACIVLSICFTIITTVVGMVVGPLAALLGLVWMLVWLAIMCLWVFMMYKAYTLSSMQLPVIGAMAKKQADAI